MRRYYRPLVQIDPSPPAGAQRLAGGWGWFTHVERLQRGRPPEVVGADAVPVEVLARLCARRPPLAGLTFGRPRIMGILNVTPDSFSDGGRFAAPERALARAREMAAAGADLIDIGGESTRPGAGTVPEAEEIARTAPVIGALSGQLELPISIDTRKGAVARAALQAGAAMVNDVSALGFDPQLAGVVAEGGVPVCLMHARGTPETMQDDPRYDDVLLDVYDALAARIAAAEAAGIRRERIIVDPGIGFGKTLQHNLALLRGIALFHGLGCPVLLGASRKSFIGRLSGEAAAGRRLAGSLAVALAAMAQGVQIVRVHDVAETVQARALWLAATGAAAADPEEQAAEQAEQAEQEAGRQR